MDASEVRAIVEREAQPLMDRLGVSYWTIYINYDLSESTAEQTVAGYCYRNTNYDTATISLDPRAFKAEADVLATLRHELFHVVLSPFDVLWNVAEEAWKGDPVKVAMMEEVRRHACEQGVIALERMYRGLTRPATAAPKVTTRRASQPRR